MFNLKDPNISYIVASNDVAASMNYLYSRESYHLIEMSKYFNGQFDRSIIAISNTDNNQLRNDAVSLMVHFNESNVIVKYREDTSPKRINQDGTETPLTVVMYNTDSSNVSYIYEGVSFSFVDQQLYFFPKEKSDFKPGMVVECFSNNDWVEKRIFDVDTEYERMYKLLIKYKKIRIPV